MRGQLRENGYLSVPQPLSSVVSGTGATALVLYWRCSRFLKLTRHTNRIEVTSGDVAS